jgi:hypothetical protein
VRGTRDRRTVASLHAFARVVVLLTAALLVVCRRLQAVLTKTKPAIGRTPAEYAGVYSRRSRLRPAASGSTVRPQVMAPVPPRAERGSATERLTTCRRRSRKPAEAEAPVPKSPSPPCDGSPSPPLIDAHVRKDEGDPIEKWLQEKRQKQAAVSRRQERKRQADLKFTARMQGRQKDRVQTARLEARCSALVAEVESTLKALENAWRQEADRARPSSHRSSRSSVEFATQKECARAGEAVCTPLRARLRQINDDARRCQLGANQQQKSVENRLEKLQELQNDLDNAMLEENVKTAPSLATAGGLKGLAGLAKLAARATVRQSPAPLTLDDMADDIEYWSRHAQPEDGHSDGQPQPLIRGAMREIMSAYQNVRDNVAWRASMDPTGRHSESLRALSQDGSQLQSPEQKLPSSARARAAARRGQPLTSTRQGLLA